MVFSNKNKSSWVKWIIINRYILNLNGYANGIKLHYIKNLRSLYFCVWNYYVSQLLAYNLVITTKYEINFKVKFNNVLMWNMYIMVTMLISVNVIKV